MGDVQSNEPKRIVKILEVFGNIFGLNILFLVFSIPIVTIGASMTAMYSVTLKMVRHEEGTLGHSFVKAFKENFKKSTIIWLLLLIAIVVIYAEILMVSAFEGYISTIYMIVVIVECLLMILTLPFLFPLIARYDNSIIMTIKNAFLLAISNLGSWIKALLIWVMPIVLSLYYPVLLFYTWYLWLIIMFGLMAYCSSFPIRKTFDRVAKVQETNENKISDAKIEIAKEQELRKEYVKAKMKKFENPADSDDSND